MYLLIFNVKTLMYLHPHVKQPSNQIIIIFIQYMHLHTMNRIKNKYINKQINLHKIVLSQLCNTFRLEKLILNAIF